MTKRCERDQRLNGTFTAGGCEAAATERVATIDDDVHEFCAAHATEARRLNGLLLRIASGDPEGKRLDQWIREAGDDRAEYDRRVATLPEVRR